MHCPSCNKPLKPNAHFCGHCGYKLSQKPISEVKPRELFSIEKSSKPSTSSAEIESDDNFFEDSVNPLTDDSEEVGWVDDRKVFSEEDDPTVSDDPPKKEDQPAKKLDSKTLAKLKAKKPKGPSIISKSICGLQSLILLCVISVAPLYLAYIHQDKLYLQIFLLLPLVLLFFWPVSRKKGLTLNMAFKLSNLWYCGAIVYLLVLCKKAGLSPTIFNEHWNGFLIQIDLWLLFHLYFIFFCQSLIFYLWRSKVNWLLKVTPLGLMAYSLIELFIQLKTTTTIYNLGSENNIITAQIKPFIGDFGLYISPHFIMTHLFLPLAIITVLAFSFLMLVQKKWSQSISLLLYSLQGLIFLSIYLLPYRNVEISSRIFSFGPLIDQIIKIILESIPIII